MKGIFRYSTHHGFVYSFGRTSLLIPLARQGIAKFAEFPKRAIALRMIVNPAWTLTVAAHTLADTTMQREPSNPILAELDDHTLIGLVAGASGQHPAATVLLLRHFNWMRRCIIIDGHRLGLSLPDIEDAQQTLLPDIVPRAIASFRPSPPELGSGQSFQSFLRNVLRRRLRNFARAIRRAERHFDRSVDVYTILELGLASSRRREWFEDPGRSAELCELLACLEFHLQQLRAAERLLWQMTVSRCPLAEIARELHVQYRTAKRRRKRLFAKLRRLLGDHLPGMNND